MQTYNTKRTLARLRLCRWHMRHEGKLLTQGKTYTAAASTDVRKTWALYDWSAPSETRHERA